MFENHLARTHMQNRSEDNTLSFFLTRLKEILPQAAFAQVEKSFSAKKPIAFRINTLKADSQNTCDALKKNFTLTKIDWLQNAFLIPAEEREALTHHPLFLNGDIYIQSLASQLPALALDPKPHEEILDLTAAPGSKTTQIAALMQNTGRIAAVEMARNRFFKLKANASLQGASNIDFYLKDGARVGKLCPVRFDRVLLDAPCSSEGRFDFNNPDSYAYWSLKKIKAMQKKQWSLLQSAFDALKPGGILVYSTCTFAPEENEMTVQRLIDKVGDQLQLLPIDIALPTQNKMAGLTNLKDKTFNIALKKAVRILPDENTDGFFIAKMKKSE